jgi:hypothetical protein
MMRTCSQPCVITPGIAALGHVLNGLSIKSNAPFLMAAGHIDVAVSGYQDDWATRSYAH